MPAHSRRAHSPVSRGALPAAAAPQAGLNITEADGKPDETTLRRCRALASRRGAPRPRPNGAVGGHAHARRVGGGAAAQGRRAARKTSRVMSFASPRVRVRRRSPGWRGRRRRNAACRVPSWMKRGPLARDFVVSFLQFFSFHTASRQTKPEARPPAVVFGGQRSGRGEREGARNHVCG